jgi:anti-sigma-K factor RskA
VLSRLAGEEATGSGLAAVRHMMAGEYALGLVPPDAFTPFQRGLALDPGLQKLVAGWDERFAPWLETIAVEAPVPASTPLTVPVTTPRPAEAVPAEAPPRRGRGGLRVAAASGGVALLALGLGVWLVGGMPEPPPRVAADALPAPRRAEAATFASTSGPFRAGEAVHTDAQATAGTVGPAPPAPTAPAVAGLERVVGTPAAMPARRATALPPQEVTSTVTVRIFHRASDPDVAERAGAFAETLDGLGAAVELVATEGLVVSADRLRFFIPADAAAARAVADALPGVVLQDFTHYTPSPAAGTLELWLASEVPG